MPSNCLTKALTSVIPNGQTQPFVLTPLNVENQSNNTTLETETTRQLENWA